MRKIMILFLRVICGLSCTRKTPRHAVFDQKQVLFPLKRHYFEKNENTEHMIYRLGLENHFIGRLILSQNKIE